MSDKSSDNFSVSVRSRLQKHFDEKPIGRVLRSLTTEAGLAQSALTMVAPTSKELAH